MKPLANSPLRFAAVAALALASTYQAFAPGPALAQDYPVKPIRVMLPFTGGGETNARIVSARLGEDLGVPFVLETQSAAGGVVAFNAVAHAAPDGYTLLYGISALVLRQFLVKDIPYNVVRDFTPIAQLGSTTYGIASYPAFPANSLTELIEYAKRNPGKVSYATSGLGSSQHLAGILLEQMAGISMLHVPYKAEAQSVPDLLAGRVQLLISTTSSLTPLVKSGKAKMLAIPSPSRYEGMPEVPTIAEVLPGYEVPPGFFGYFGPARLPQAIVKRLSDAIVKAANSPDVKSKLASVGVLINTAPHEEFAASIRRNVEVTGKLMKAARIQPE